MVAVLKEQQTHFDEVLRRAGIALQGRDVGVWEVRANGRVSPVAVSSSHRSPTETTVELDNVLASWGIERGTGSRWLGCRLEQGGQWCVAPVRADAPEPPPAGIERRSPERMTLELAGLCIGLMDDTTGRVSGHALRQANSLLRESQARLDLLARTTPAILWTTDAALRITSTSGAGLEEVGLTPDQLVGISLLDGPNALGAHADAISAHMRALGGDTASYRIEWTGRVYDARVEALVDDRGVVTGVAGISRDVTDRERAMQALKRTQRELDDLFENAPVGVNFVARDGTILRANKAELQLLGYERGNYVGHNIREFHLDPQAIDDALFWLEGGQQLMNYEAAVRHADGSDRRVVISSNAIFEDGKLMHMRSFTRAAAA